MDLVRSTLSGSPVQISTSLERESRFFKRNDKMRFLCKCDCIRLRRPHAEPECTATFGGGGHSPPALQQKRSLQRGVTVSPRAAVKQETCKDPEAPTATSVPTITAAEPPAGEQRQGVARPHLCGEGGSRGEGAAAWLREVVRSLEENTQWMGAAPSGTEACDSHLSRCPEERAPVAAGRSAPLPTPVLLLVFSEIMYN